MDSVPARLPAFERLLGAQGTRFFGGVEPAAADYFVFEGAGRADIVVFALVVGLAPALLSWGLVQFVGIPFSLIFGRLPSPQHKRRPFYLAFILFNLVALPVLGAITQTLSDAGRAPRRRRMKHFYAASGALGGLFVLLLMVEIIQRGMVA